MYTDLDEQGTRLFHLKDAALDTLYDLMARAKRDSDRRAAAVAVLRYVTNVEKSQQEQAEASPRAARATRVPAPPSVPEPPNSPRSCAATCPQACTVSACHSAAARTAPIGPPPPLRIPNALAPEPLGPTPALAPEPRPRPTSQSLLGTATIESLIEDAPECTCGSFCHTMHRDRYLPCDPMDICGCENQCLGATLCNINCRQKITAIALIGASAALNGEPVKQILDPEGFADENYVFEDDNPESPDPDPPDPVRPSNSPTDPPTAQPETPASMPDPLPSDDHSATGAAPNTELTAAAETAEDAATSSAAGDSS